MQNAGIRLWQIQKRQGTGLCVGLDPHYDPNSELNEGFYTGFASSEAMQYAHLFNAGRSGSTGDALRSATFLCGVVGYYLQVIRSAWACGIRIYKPQIAFFERFAPFGLIVLEILSDAIRGLSNQSGEDAFVILDAKRGDIDSTQAPYYFAYLADHNTEVFPGANGVFGFDAITVTTWMGADVLTPGLPFFRQGKAAIVVTRTSNPSGTVLQDREIGVEAVPQKSVDELESILGRRPTAHELMLHDTEQFSRLSGLDHDGVSPLFSVMGSTIKMSDSFRRIRPYGIALVPGFGAQGGKFENIMPLYIGDGPLAGHVGVLSSSRDHNFPWMKRSGGMGDPAQLDSEMRRAVDSFRAAEKRAYAEFGAKYPF